MSIPDVVDEWLSILFSAIGDGNPDGDVAALLVELFDAVMSTFAWVRADESLVEPIDLHVDDGVF